MSHLPEDERRSPRSKVFLSAVLEWPDRKLTVVLRDLSEHGALVEMKSEIPADSELTFCRNELRVRGYVAWVGNGTAGIGFARPLKADVLLRHINRPARRPVDDSLYRRPGFTNRNMSDEEQRWFAEMSRQPRADGRD